MNPRSTNSKTPATPSFAIKYAQYRITFWTPDWRLRFPYLSTSLAQRSALRAALQGKTRKVRDSFRGADDRVFSSALLFYASSRAGRQPAAGLATGPTACSLP